MSTTTCIYGHVDCDCPKCFSCGLCTSGGQFHRSCMFVQKDESKISEEEFYEIMAAEHEEEYRRESVKVRTIPLSMQIFIPESAIVSGKIELDRYIRSTTSILMYRFMRTQWTNLFRLPLIEMVVELVFDLDEGVVLHPHCVVDAEKGTFTPACMFIRGMRAPDLMQQIDRNPEYFFCDHCDRSIVHNFEKWEPKLILNAIRDIGQPLTIRSMSYGDITPFEIKGKHNALMKDL